jgi:hypothetical protein
MRLSSHLKAHLSSHLSAQHSFQLSMPPQCLFSAKFISTFYASSMPVQRFMPFTECRSSSCPRMSDVLLLRYPPAGKTSAGG